MTDKEQEFLMRELKNIQNFCKTHKSCIECLFVDVGINFLLCIVYFGYLCAPNGED